MPFLELFNDFLSKFNPFLDNYLQEQTKLVANFNQLSSQNLTQIQKTVDAGGKRLRPALVNFAYLLSASTSSPNIDIKTIYQIGSSLELLHTFALIHDDIIDKSLTRRSKPTVEANYRDIFSSKFPQIDTQENQHLSLSAAILAGDLSHILANTLINQLDIENSLKQKISDLYYQLQLELICGQIDDCFGVGLEDFEQLSEGKIINMLKLKSGNYSLQKPILIGAILAGASQDKLEILSKVGENLGLVFQLKDDILGIFGDPLVTGKPVGSDIIQGKRTLLMHRAYQKMNPSVREQMATLFGKTTIETSEIAWVKEQILSLGVFEEMQVYCLDLLAEAKKLLQNNFEDSEGLEFLLGLSDYLWERGK